MALRARSKWVRTVTGSRPVIAAISDGGMNAELARVFEEDLANAEQLKLDRGKESFGVRWMKSAARLAAPLL